MVRRRSAFIILATLVSYVVVAPSAQAATVSATVDHIHYEADDSSPELGATVTGGDTELPSDVVIPAQVSIEGTEYDVTDIYPSAFDDAGLTSVSLPNTLTTIGPNSFAGNALTSVTIPDSVTTIGSAAFTSNSIESLTIGGSVAEIGSYAFADNLIESITFGPEIADIGSSAFDFNSSLSTILFEGDAPTLGTPASFGTNDPLPTVSFYEGATGFTTPTWNGGGDTEYPTEMLPRPSEGFSDVPDSHPFFDEVMWGVQAGITTGYDDGTFRPTAPVTRQALAAFLYRADGVGDFDPPATSPFTDVPTTHPFYTEIAWMAAEGISTGYDDDTFRPNGVVTRQATAAFLFRAVGPESFDDPATPAFSDVSPSHPFFTEIEWMAGEEISTGYTDGTFRPTADVTRQAAMAFLYRAVEGDA